MRITPSRPPINLYIDGFRGRDRFDRSAESKALSELVEKVDEPLVISVDGKWGSGKSYFLQCWAGAHTVENDGEAITIYYDAFKDDFLENPLAGLMAHLSKRVGATEQSEGKLARVKSAASKLWRPTVRVALAMASSGLSELASPILDAGIDAAQKEISDQVDAFWMHEVGKRGAIEEFRQALIGLTAPDDNGNPTQKFVFIVDELDRCRPDFALSVLEVIKHFFDVDGVHFVLGVHLAALKNTVRARYGNSLDAEKYLGKFISVGITLKDVTRKSDSTGAEIWRYFSTEASQMGLPAKQVEHVLWWAKAFEPFSFDSIRHAQRILTEIALLPSEEKMWGWGLTLSALVLIKHSNSELYRRFSERRIALKEILDFCGIPEELKGQERHEVVVADYIWRSILAPKTVNPESGFTGAWGHFGLSKPNEVVPKLIREIELVKLT